MQPTSAARQLSDQERQWLLRLARETVEATAWGRRAPSPANPGGRLGEPAAVFVSLHCDGELRGCIGQLGLRQPLYLALVDAARSAARNDLRFQPLSPEDLPSTEIEISVLSAMCEVAAAEAEQAIEIGHHGLMISQYGRRGLLLPQVPGQYGWTSREFLEQTCRKAGLHRDAWRQGAFIQMFTAEVFAEEKAAGASA